MMKYKPCCGTGCLVGGCRTREAGGCYCVCRLKDREQTLQDLIYGKCYRRNGVIVYEAGIEKVPVHANDRRLALAELEKVRERLKKYEIEEE